MNAAAVESSREIALTRVFDAPRELVFRMWTSAEHLANWWGPHGFTLTTHEFEFRPGGAWVSVMHGPDGTDYRNRIVFDEIEAPRRIAYRHVSGPVFDAEATFEERGGKTAVTVRMTFATAELRDRVAAEFGAVEGLEQTLERLGQLAAEAFVITRTFAAPRELVFRAWTEVEHLQRWWGPKGMAVTHCTLDLRPGGAMHYELRSPDGNGMWARWIFRDIVPPERLVFAASFSDEQGGVTRAPFFDGGWPMETMTTVTFEEREGSTIVTLVSIPVDATEAERETFRNANTSMQGGWSGTLDQLAGYLETQQS